MVSILPLVVCASAVLALLVAERLGSRTGVWCSKPVASLAFVWVAVAGGAAATTYGTCLLIALVLCLAGDLLLIPAERPAAFRAGVLAFMLGHLAYIAAFLTRPISWLGLLGAGFMAFGMLRPVLRWLRPHLTADMVLPVRAYVVVIGAMAAVAVSVTLAGAPWLVAVGAIAFALSDVSVARDRFVAPGFANRAWGLPLYYAAQCAIALTPSLLR